MRYEQMRYEQMITDLENIHSLTDEFSYKYKKEFNSISQLIRPIISDEVIEIDIDHVSHACTELWSGISIAIGDIK